MWVNAAILFWTPLFFTSHSFSTSHSASAQDLNFTDVTQQSGITFEHSTGRSGDGYIAEGVASGVATFDFDGDGWIDIYFLNGSPIGQPNAMPLKNALYRNNGDMTFTDVTDSAGVGDTGFGLGVAVADYDGDGYEDIYVNNYGPNVLYRNRGDKTFEDVTEAAGVANGNQLGAGVSFLDIEGDGDLDLYVGNYVDFTLEKHVSIAYRGIQFTASPQYYNALPDTLFRNDGNGKFTDVSAESGISQLAGPSMGLVAADFDDDGDTDVYVCNDGTANYFFVNDGNGRFTESGLLQGLAYSFTGRANSSMGVDCADFDGDGLLDLFATNYQGEMPNLYRNLGDGLFEDAANRARIADSLLPHVNWATIFLDADNDGDRDLFIACGHLDRVEGMDDRTALKVRDYLLTNDRGIFSDVSESVGITQVETSRGAAAEDFDNDGDIDLLVLNSNARPTLFRNEFNAKNHWIKLELTQAGDNTGAIGAVVTVSAGDLRQVQHRIAGRGYQSHFGSLMHFGLGSHADDVSVSVRWPDGVVQEFEVSADQLHNLQRKTP